MADKSDAGERGDTAEQGGGDKPKRSKMKLIIMVLPTLLIVGGAGWFFLLRGDGGSKTPTAPASHAGPVVSLDPITINLAGGHYLKLGLALQTDSSAPEVDGSRALDLAITEFSGRTIDDLASASGRNAAKTELITAVREAYLPEGSKPVATVTPTRTAADPTPTPTAVYAVAPAVYDVYFTEFVMQ